METQLFNTRSFTEKGKRDQNEDAIFPDPNENYTVGILDNLFLVCDGVGGSQKGEIASDTICTQMSKFFIDNAIGISDEDTIKRGLKFVESKFDAIIVESVESAGMGSTLTLLHLHENGATIGHVGDSRVYLFRDGKIVFRTKDHSRVQQYLDSGLLKNEEEARNHPEGNVILRAVRGASVGPTKVDVSLIKDLKEGDIFLLCSDGVIESFSDPELEGVFNTKPSLDAITATIIQKCRTQSSDNFSAFFIELNKEYVENIRLQEQPEEQGSSDIIEEKAQGDVQEIIKAEDFIKQEFLNSNEEKVSSEEEESVNQLPPSGSAAIEINDEDSEETLLGAKSDPNLKKIEDENEGMPNLNYVYKKKSDNKLLWVILISLALFFLSGAIYYYVFGNGKTSDVKKNEHVPPPKRAGKKVLSTVVDAIKNKESVNIDSLLSEVELNKNELDEFYAQIDSLQDSEQTSKLKEALRKYNIVGSIDTTTTKDLSI